MKGSNVRPLLSFVSLRFLLIRRAFARFILFRFVSLHFLAFPSIDRVDPVDGDGTRDTDLMRFPRRIGLEWYWKIREREISVYEDWLWNVKSSWFKLCDKDINVICPFSIADTYSLIIQVHLAEKWSLIIIEDWECSQRLLDLPRYLSNQHTAYHFHNDLSSGISLQQ